MSVIATTYTLQQKQNFIKDRLLLFLKPTTTVKRPANTKSLQLAIMGLPTYSEATTSTTTSSQTPQQEQNSTGVATGAGANTGAGVTRPKTEEENEADRLYEEAMEEEYAKRDGGS